jgi:hypothetical protein
VILTQRPARLSARDARASDETGGVVVLGRSQELNLRTRRRVEMPRRKKRRTCGRGRRIQHGTDAEFCIDIVEEKSRGDICAPLRFVSSISDAGGNAGGCSPKGATPRCACRSLRIGLPTSTPCASATEDEGRHRAGHGAGMRTFGDEQGRDPSFDQRPALLIAGTSRYAAEEWFGEQCGESCCSSAACGQAGTSRGIAADGRWHWRQ